VVGRLRHVRGCALRLLGGRVDHDGGLIDGRHQFAQLLDCVVDGVRYCTGDVLGDCRLDSKVTVGQAAELVEKTEDCLLITVILLRLHPRGLFENRHPGVQEEQETDDQQRDDQHDDGDERCGQEGRHRRTPRSFECASIEGLGRPF
jgi:hypothetical protein